MPKKALQKERKPEEVPRRPEDESARSQRARVPENQRAGEATFIGRKDDVNIKATGTAKTTLRSTKRKVGAEKNPMPEEK